MKIGTKNSQGEQRELQNCMNIRLLYETITILFMLTFLKKIYSILIILSNNCFYALMKMEIIVPTTHNCFSIFLFHVCQDDRSPLSSGESSDESSSVEAGVPSHAHDQVLRRQRQKTKSMVKKQNMEHNLQKQQQQYPPKPVQNPDGLRVS